jgi:hypothetical protein
MVLKYTVGGIIRGTVAEKSTVNANVPLNTLYIETDTDKIYRYAGSSVWNELTSSGDPINPISQWIVYKSGSNYKAKNGTTGLTPYTGTNLKTDVWNNIKSNPASRTRIHFLNNTDPYDIPSGQTLDIPSTQHYHLSGESMHGVRIRPLGNDNAISLTNVRHGKIEGIHIYIDQGASYTNDPLKIIGNAGGVESIELANIKIRHDAGGSTFNQEGNNVVFLLQGADPNISWINAHDCHVYGGNSAILLTTSSASVFPWANEFVFTRFHGTHCKSFCISDIPAVAGSITNSSASHWTFRDCNWQTTKVEATTLDMFKITNNARHRVWDIDNCYVWDIASTNNKYLNVNSTDCRISVNNCEPIGDPFMAGTSWDATNGVWNNVGVSISRQSYFSVKRGATSVGDGGTITHGMRDVTALSSTINVVPKVINVVGSVAGEFVSVTAKSSTTFTVAIKKWTGGTLTAGTTQTVYWEAREYV